MLTIQATAVIIFGLTVYPGDPIFICSWESAILFWLIPLIVGVVSLFGSKLFPVEHRGIVEYPICSSCGYNLTGNVSGRCPECGVLISP